MLTWWKEVAPTSKKTNLLYAGTMCLTTLSGCNDSKNSSGDKWTFCRNCVPNQFKRIVNIPVAEKRSKVPPYDSAQSSLKYHIKAIRLESNSSSWQRRKSKNGRRNLAVNVDFSRPPILYSCNNIQRTNRSVCKLIRTYQPSGLAVSP